VARIKSAVQPEAEAQPLRLVSSQASPSASRPAASGAGSRGRKRGITVGPTSIGLVVVAFLLVSGWAAGATMAIMLGDKLSARLIAQQSDMQYAYEQKLVVFRAQLDAFARQERMERSGVEGRVADLMLRQAALEARQAMLTNLAEQIRGPLGARYGQTGGAATGRPMQQVSTFRIMDSSQPVERRVDHIGRSVERTEFAQLQTLNRFLSRSESVFGNLRLAFVDVGLSPEQFGGGPRDSRPSVASLIPLGDAVGEGQFEARIADARRTLAALSRLRTAASTVPFARPVDETSEEISSSFGYRSDPFTGEQRFHAGLDFRAPEGTPVYASGSGVVEVAGLGGGYGNLVIVDHGNGLKTRYGHLSAFRVSQGQPVSPGTLIGLVGSTGRSTGPHLHYETRVQDEPENPKRFILAGVRLGLQN
jgi:murein DD-endopeptidase MepM/ murein hydrolase activator NlpD